MEPANISQPTRAKKGRGLLFSFLVMLSLGGVAITDYSQVHGLWYWMILTVCFGAASVVLSWYASLNSDDRARQEESVWSHFSKQSLHWLTLLVVFVVIYFVHDQTALQPETKGMVALLLLSLTTILAGLHFDWRMAILGLILLGTFAARALVNDLFWAILIVAVVAAFMMPRIKKANANR